MRPDPDFEILAGDPSASVEELALAMASALRDTDREGALERLDSLGEQLGALLGGGGAGPEAEAWACAELLGGRHGLSGDRDDYDNPDNSMLDLVLERRRGLPIALSVVYVAAARRAGIELEGVGLPGHFVVAHFGASPPLLLDPFGGGARVAVQPGAERLVRPWHPHETALRMLNNLVAGYERRVRLGDAIRAARLRLALPVPDAERARLEEELVALEARLN
jgi:regulator of sirC expression with transglutaminase-like and TPR domain